jgi:hypothetical protein
MNDMQDDASKEGNDVDAAIIRLPTPKQTKHSPGKTNGRRPKRRTPEPTSRGPPPKPRRSQSMERQQATLDGDDEDLPQGRRPRATTTTRRGKEL